MSQQQRLGTHATTTRHNAADDLIVRYQQTDVVRVSSTLIYLDTGGWFTATTKTRMNQAANQYNLGFHVYAKKGKWFVQTRSGSVHEFTANGLNFLKAEAAI